MWEWLSDFGSGVGDVFSSIGSGVADAARGVGSFASSLAPVFSTVGSGLNLATKFLPVATGAAGVYNAVQGQQQAAQQQDYLDTLQRNNQARSDQATAVAAQREQDLAAYNAQRLATDQARQAQIDQYNQQRLQLDRDREAKIDAYNQQRLAYDQARVAEADRLNAERAASDQARLDAIAALNAERAAADTRREGAIAETAARREAAMRPVQEAGAAQYQTGVRALAGEAPLPPALEARVIQQTADTRQRVRDYLARAGIGDSSMAVQFESWINNQEQQLRGQLARELQIAGVEGFRAGTVQPEALARPSDQRTAVGPSDQRTVIAPSNQAQLVAPSDRLTLVAPTDQQQVIAPSYLIPQDPLFAQIAANQGARTQDLLGASQRALQSLAAASGGRAPVTPSTATTGGDPFGFGAATEAVQPNTSEALLSYRAGEREDPQMSDILNQIYAL